MASTVDHILAKNALLNAAFDKAIVAKLNCQPLNTKKQYKGYQRQQDVRTNINYISQDKIHPLTNVVYQEFYKKHNFSNSVIVIEKKVCLQLQEDILLRRVPIKATKAKVKGNRILSKCKRGTNIRALASSDPAEASMLLSSDNSMLDADTIVDADADANASLSAPNGTLLKAGTINSYVAAVAELYAIQVTSSYNKEPFFRGKALNQLIEARCCQRD